MHFPTWSIVITIIASVVWIVSTIGLHITRRRKEKKALERTNNFRTDDNRGIDNHVYYGRVVGTGDVQSAEQSVDHN